MGAGQCRRLGWKNSSGSQGVVGSGMRCRSDTPKIELVTPVAQILEMGKLELARKKGVTRSIMERESSTQSEVWQLTGNKLSNRRSSTSVK
jgi:hypothetical protein